MRYFMSIMYVVLVTLLCLMTWPIGSVHNWSRRELDIA